MTETMMTERKALGKGLAALLGEGAPSSDKPRQEKKSDGQENGGIPAVRQLPVDALRPGKYQPRRHFAPEALQDLAESIRLHGIMQPLVVREKIDEEDAYEIIAGERRWRAAQKAGVTTVPVMVHTVSDRQMLELAIIENVQRENLSPLEEAQAYQRLIAEFSYTQENLARVVHKSRSHVANMLRLLGLPPEVRTLIEQGKIQMGHARALLKAEEPLALAERIVKEDLSVREVEQAVREERNGAVQDPAMQAEEIILTGGSKNVNSQPTGSKAAGGTEPLWHELEKELTNALAMPVKIESKGEGGVLKLPFTSMAALEGLLARLQVTV